MVAQEAAAVRLAAGALATGRAPRISAAVLAAMLGDAEWWVRFRAAEALVAIGAPGIARLRDAAERGGGVAAEVADAILAEKGIAR